MAEGYKEKLNQPLLTDAGRQIFLQVGNGYGKLVYTRATLSSRKPVDSTGKALDDEAIRQKMDELNMKYNRINSISKIIKMED